MVNFLNGCSRFLKGVPIELVDYGYFIVSKIPQGSVVDPSLFLWHNNDLPDFVTGFDGVSINHNLVILNLQLRR